MDTDLMLVLGLAVIVLAIPALLAAFSESRPPRMAALMVLVGGILLALALTQKPSGYAFAEVPDVIMRVFARVLN
ncbi:hypothetical protein [Tabrizicola oligotrophica]|uniref:50S ribosomal protein L35 n=1 Tax=Tabrizicola oligotrophica TaxID=2710650 RepID=A0A6M0QST5_9RHOB|nr:hypothetical protein [Tabrizicola oligotrophica]NEY89914.1 hypothetical protein [Tabrizicola oligotrophica]